MDKLGAHEGKKFSFHDSRFLSLLTVANIKKSRIMAANNSFFSFLCRERSSAGPYLF